MAYISHGFRDTVAQRLQNRRFYTFSSHLTPCMVTHRHYIAKIERSGAISLSSTLDSMRLLSINATLVCVSSDTKFAVILCMYLFGYRYCHGDSDTNRRQSLHDGSSGHKVFSFGGDIFRGHRMLDHKRERGSAFGSLKAIWPRLSRKRWALHINWSLTSAGRSSFLKYKLQGSSPRVHYKQNVLNFWAFLQYRLWSTRDHWLVAVPRMTDPDRAIDL